MVKGVASGKRAPSTVHHETSMREAAAWIPPTGIPRSPIKHLTGLRSAESI
jgi:hypothetical protein